MNNKKSILSLSILLVLAGCSSIPNIEESRLAFVKDNEFNQKLDFSLSRPEIEIEKNKFWELYGDENLNYIIDSAMKNNNDIKIALLNINKSNELLGFADKANLPNLDLQSTVQRESLSETGMTPPPYAGSIINFTQTSLHASYSFDMFDKKDSLINEEKYKNDALEFKKKDVELGIIIQIIKSYGYWQYLDKDEKLIESEIKVTSDLINIMNKKVELGLAIDSDLIALKNLQKDLENNIILTKENKRILENSIKQLSANNEIELKKNENFWNNIEKEPIDMLPISVVKERPDVEYYLNLIKSQKEHLNSMKSDFYPSISLTGDLGFQKVGLVDILNPKGMFWNFGPALSLPLFDSGLIKTKYKIAGLDLNVVIEQYNKSIYKATQEINDSLYKNKSKYKLLMNKNDSYSNEEKVLKVNEEKFSLGKISLYELNNQKLSLLKAEDQKLNTEFNYLITQVDLVNSVAGVINK